MRLKASSLIQSIYLCVVILLLIGSLFMLKEAKSMLLNHYDILTDHLTQHLLIRDSLIKASDYDNEDDTAFYLENVNLKGVKKTNPWGIYKVFNLTSIQFLINDTLKSSYISKRRGNETNSFTVVDKGFSLRYTGKVSIQNNYSLPQSSYMGNTLKPFDGNLSNLIITGGRLPSKNRLEKLHDVFQIPTVFNEFRFRESEMINIYSNPFSLPTHELILDKESLSDIRVTGNIIITSLSKVIIKKSAVLKDCIIVAPIIEFEEGSSASGIQILAEKSIILNQNVTLKDNCVLFVNNDSKNGLISIGANCSVTGNLVLLSNGYENEVESSSMIILEETCSVKGDVYSQGLAYLSGSIVGNIMVDNIGVKKGKDDKANVIGNLNISSPEFYNEHGLSWELKDTTNEIIKKLY